MSTNFQKTDITKKILKEKTEMSLRSIFAPGLDQIYVNGYVCCVIVTPPLKMSGNIFLVEDEERYPTHVAIYCDVPESKLQVGTKLKISNPYSRISINGMLLIRVDKEEDLEFLPKVEMCGECLLVQDSLMCCSRCGIAKYCSKECQTKDWKLRAHKIHCKPAVS